MNQLNLPKRHLLKCRAAFIKNQTLKNRQFTIKIHLSRCFCSSRNNVHKKMKRKQKETYFNLTLIQDDRVHPQKYIYICQNANIQTKFAGSSQRNLNFSSKWNKCQLNTGQNEDFIWGQLPIYAPPPSSFRRALLQVLIWSIRVLAILSLRETDYTVHIAPSTGLQAPKLPWPLPWVQLQAQSKQKV